MKNIFRTIYFWLVLSFVVATLGSMAMSESSMSWYQQLNRSSITPPSAAFPIVWTVLYAMMGYAAYRVSRISLLWDLFPYILQLVFNLAWSWLFFYFQQPGIALIDFVLLICSLIWTIMVFRNYDVKAALLLIPYLMWGIFAFWLNLFVVLYN